ncbi:DNA -binding domain-containing protein [Rhodomicrobium vannielii]
MHAQPRFLIDIEDKVSLHLRMGGTVVRLPVLNETPLKLGNDIAFTIYRGQEWGSIERISRGFRQMQDPTAWTAQRLSLRDALIAFDRTHAGLRYRDIACLLLGDARVDQEWQIGRTALKDRIRRAVKRGEKLVGGGYRALLRPSASSRDTSSRNRVPGSGHPFVYGLQGGVV